MNTPATPPPHSTALECEQVSKIFAQGALRVTALNAINLRVAIGESLALTGTSGSGKTTLLHILGGLDKPTTGTIRINGTNINHLSPKASGTLRNRTLGFVYQFHHLLMEFTALENVAMPLLIRHLPRHQALTRAAEMLDRVGLAKRAAHKPGELSGGERQRTAIARAAVTQPLCILADEPTGNLDSKTATTIHDLLLELNHTFNTSLIIATHDHHLARKLSRTVTIEDGTLTPPPPLSLNPRD